MDNQENKPQSIYRVGYAAWTKGEVIDALGKLSTELSWAVATGEETDWHAEAFSRAADMLEAINWRVAEVAQ